MSEHSQNQNQVQNAQPIQQQDPQYELDPNILKKQQQQVKQTIFSSLLQNNLSKFNRIFDGTSYAYTKLSLINRRLFQILPMICSYKHLRQITLQHNFLLEFDNLLYLKYLIKLDLSNNKIQDIRSLDNTQILPFLNQLNLSNNKIKRLVNIPLSALKILILSNNQIQKIQFEGNKTIQKMYLKNNKLRDIGKLSHFQKLEMLDLSENHIDDISNLQELPQLNTLLLSKNRIDNIGEGFKGIGKVIELDLKENRIAKLQGLKGVVDSVRTLIISQNPLSQQLGENVKKQIWIMYRFYTKIDDSEIEVQQKLDWDKQYKDRKEQERQRLQQQRLEQQQKQREQRERQQAERQAKEAEQKLRLQQQRQRLQEERRLKAQQEQKHAENEQQAKNKNKGSQNQDQEGDD